MRIVPAHGRERLHAFFLAIVLLAPAYHAIADRAPVLPQIDIPHSYYYREMYLPQFTSGPSSLSWSPDGKALVYSMQGSLWRQDLTSERAVQLTAGPGYDYLPDWSPDGRRIVFSRYHDDALELYLLELKSGSVQRLTSEGAVNLDARWSPDGRLIAFVSTRDTGRFHLRIGGVHSGEFASQPLFAERRSTVPRYYYSPYDHQLSPTWSPDGKELIYVANPETHYGTGSLWRRGIEAHAEATLIRSEETTWKARPDWSPEGKRVIYSSYLGRQWHQLWLTTAAGDGDPLPLSYGDYDITHARWSRDGARIAYVSNATGNTSIWVQEVVSGRRTQLRITGREFLQPTGRVRVLVKAPDGKPAPARLYVTDANGRQYVPYDAWAHADDGFDRAHRASEIIYFHTEGETVVTVPPGETRVTVWRGLEHQITKRSIEARAGETVELTVTPELLALPAGWNEQWISGDVHVHMNYGGAYRNTPAHLVQQAAAEDLDVVHNLIVNKEQRIPDIEYFSAHPDAASNDDVLVLHGQEYQDRKSVV